MISLTGHIRVDACPEPIDFRSGMNRLIGLVRERTDEEPMSGALFAFVNRKMTEIKLMVLRRLFGLKTERHAPEASKETSRKDKGDRIKRG